MNLIKQQRLVAEEHFDSTIFLEGVTGTGKTTAGIERVKQLLKTGVSAASILILVPQPSLGLQWRTALKRARVEGSANVRVATLGSLATEVIDLYLPLIAADVGFENPLQAPHYLSLELVQYYMRRFVEPEIQQHDLFNSVHASPYRLYTQIIDNLNKAALVGFPYQDIAPRLKEAWGGDAEQTFIYDDAQRCANVFREICRSYNLLDFSLQVNLFKDYLWKLPLGRNYLTRQYRHLMMENAEEDTPAMHDLLADWLPECDSGLVIYDSEAGYRRFLGADPTSAYTLKPLCKVHVSLDKQRIMSPELEAFQSQLGMSLNRSAKAPKGDARSAIVMPATLTYLPQMLDWVAKEVQNLIVNQGVAPSEIVLVSAFLPDAMRFMLQARLEERGIPHRSLRPSRALRDEPATRNLLILAKLAHPAWSLTVTAQEVAVMLSATINDCDLIRARLLVESAYVDGQLKPFESHVTSVVKERITFQLGTRYEILRLWIENYHAQESQPLDVFLSRIFGEVLSQPDFSFHNQLDAANTTANLIDSTREFRQIIGRIETDRDLPKEYVQMVDAGVIANQYLHPPGKKEENAVLIAPAHAFLMSNTPVDYQFWLNIGSSGWGKRLYQPLTQPYVLSRQWQEGRVWTDEDENNANQQELYTLLSGLIRRCRKQIYLGYSQLSEQGYEQRGAVLLAVHSMLRRLSREQNDGG